MYRQVIAKQHEIRLARAVLLARQQLARQQLAGQRRTLENQIRALLRGFGLAVGGVGRAHFEARIRELLASQPLLEVAVAPLLAV